MQIGRLRPSEIDEHLLAKYMQLDGLPDPDLCIRTAGEQRISNFLLADGLYRILLCRLLLADFDAAALDLAVDEYYSRQRRFGLRAAPSSEEQPAARGRSSVLKQRVVTAVLLLASLLILLFNTDPLVLPDYGSGCDAGRLGVGRSCGN